MLGSSYVVLSYKLKSIAKQNWEHVVQYLSYKFKVKLVDPKILPLSAQCVEVGW